MLHLNKKLIKKGFTSLLIFFLLFSGFPTVPLFDYLKTSIKDKNVVDILYNSKKKENIVDRNILELLTPKVKQANAANFSMQTGYYMGTGSTKSITGVGFQPQFLLIKSNTTAGVAVFKTSAMPTANVAFTSATSDNTASQLSLDSDGFTVQTLANLNTANVRYQWTAFSGSDCTSGGTFCVGQYSGNGSSTQTINTGFQPDLVIVKRTTAADGNFRVTSHPANRASYFTTTADVTNGALIASFTSSGFTVGSTNNASGGTYNYIAFKESSGVFKQGSYSGDGVDNRNITGIGFQPDAVFIKNSTNATAANRGPALSLNESYGDFASGIGVTTALTVNLIQGFQSDGFQVGNGARTNNSGDTFYYAAFGGAPSYSSSGTFEMANGTYTGTGSSFSVTDVGFAPDLVIIKDHAANHSVFRMKLMNGNITAYLGAATGDFADGITSLDSDGFSLGISTIINTNGNTYEWIAFGNAFNPYTNTGSSDFAIGVYTGNGIDNTNISRIPWQPDFVTAKRNGASAAVFKTSSHTGEATSQYAASADLATNNIQSFNSEGFQIGNPGNALNASGTLYRWFAFKNGDNFVVGTYSGDDVDNRNITAGFEPDWVMIKRSTAVAGVHRSATLAGDTTQYFVNTVNASGRIKSFVSNGFQIGTQTEVNASGGTYYYVSWKKSGPSISISITTDGVISYGTLSSAQNRSTIDLSDTQTVRNDSNVAVDLNIRTNAPSGWSLGSSSAEDIFVHEFSTNSGSNWTKFTTADAYQTLTTNLAVDGTQNFDLRFTAPNPSTTATEKTLTITLQAVEAN